MKNNNPHDHGNDHNENNNHSKPKHAMKCEYCYQPFNRPEAICNRCGACVACGLLNADKFGNLCIHCFNFIDQARYNVADRQVIIHHNPQSYIREDQAWKEHNPKNKQQA